MEIREHPSYQYAEKVLKREVNAPKYVIAQCREFKAIADGQDKTQKYGQTRKEKPMTWHT